MHGNTTNIMHGARHERSNVLVKLVYFGTVQRTVSAMKLLESGKPCSGNTVLCTFERVACRCGCLAKRATASGCMWPCMLVATKYIHPTTMLAVTESRSHTRTTRTMSHRRRITAVHTRCCCRRSGGWGPWHNRGSSRRGASNQRHHTPRHSTQRHNVGRSTGRASGRHQWGRDPAHLVEPHHHRHNAHELCCSRCRHRPTANHVDRPNPCGSGALSKRVREWIACHENRRQCKRDIRCDDARAPSDKRLGWLGVRRVTRRCQGVCVRTRSFTPTPHATMTFESLSSSVCMKGHVCLHSSPIDLLVSTSRVRLFHFAMVSATWHTHSPE
jgi:hypothetical protein